MSLERWQEQLEIHFSSLSKQRAELGLPLFALEHGLSKAEVEEISQSLIDSLTEGHFNKKVWLLWVVYAAEQGYTYEGDEYWYSFEKNTPNWDMHRRYTLAAWFDKFRSEYNGYTPSGTWASHFSIIAWPITHAILPKYLQHQFARTLYDLRYKLSRISSIEPSVIGRMIAANAYNASTRFQQFLQQEELVGRIVLGLLHTEPEVGKEPLLNATLQRIVSDLERVRNAKGWIKETSRVVKARFKGLSQTTQARPNPINFKEKRIQLRPRLYLRLMDLNNISVMIDIPSYRPLTELSSELQVFLKKTRCRINGCSGKRPAGWILSSNPKAVIESWPNTSEPLINFDSSNGILEHLLMSDCMLDDGPVWVFRIGPDGLAMEIRTKVVRPGYSYILVSRERLTPPLEEITECGINCIGVFANRINLGKTISESMIDWLFTHGITNAKTVRLWPSGLNSRNWDGEGHSEWLTTEKPCIAISTDHPVESYSITLDNYSGTVIDANQDGTPNFIQLPQLAPGIYTLSVKCLGVKQYGHSNTSNIEGYLELLVREPEPWVSGTSSHVGMVVSTDPYDPTLDVFWENEIKLSVFGPESRYVTPYVILEDTEGAITYKAKVCEQIQLPITPELWKKKFQTFLEKENDNWRYLSASSGALILSGQDLGEYTIRFEHSPIPLRWVLENQLGDLRIRLIDETGAEDLETKCYFFGFQKPLEEAPLDTAEVSKGIKVSPPGGLYIIEAGDYRDAIIISTGLAGDGLQGLGVKPHYGKFPINATSIISLLISLYRWSTARLAGPLANARQHNVVQGLLNAIYGACTDWNWVHAEKLCMNSDNHNSSIDNLQKYIGILGGFPIRLREKALDTEPEYGAMIDWFYEEASKYKISESRELCEFAINFAGRPHELLSIYNTELIGLINKIIKCPTLLKSARFIAVNWTLERGGLSDILPRWRDDSRN